MTKLFALPAIALCLYGLVFYVSAKPNWITSKSNNVSHDVAELPAAPTQKVVQAETATQERKTVTQERESPANTLDSIRAELQQLSDDIKANSDKIAQTATLRPDLLKLIQDSKSSSDEAAQTARDQIRHAALRPGQIPEGCQGYRRQGGTIAAGGGRGFSSQARGPGQRYAQGQQRQLPSLGATR